MLKKQRFSNFRWTKETRRDFASWNISERADPSRAPILPVGPADQPGNGHSRNCRPDCRRPDQGNRGLNTSSKSAKSAADLGVLLQLDGRSHLVAGLKVARHVISVHAGRFRRQRGHVAYKHQLQEVQMTPGLGL